MRVLLALLLSASASLAADWYVRPPVLSSYSGDDQGKPIPQAGVYGNQDGTSYANAWNGLREVVWGASGVDAGDTLWVCGQHIHRTTSNNYIADQALVNVTVDGVTIRGDYESDAGIVVGAFLENRPDLTWEGPDGNGVYTVTNSYAGFSDWLYPIRFELVDGVAELLRETGETTWAGSSGAHSEIAEGVENQFIYVKPIETPAGWQTNLLALNFGYRFNISTNDSINFRGLRFIASTIDVDHTKHTALAKNSHSITFTNCSWEN